MAKKAEAKTPNQFIEHGSQEHAVLLGLRKAAPQDVIVYEGWTLVDTTAFGVQATEAYIREVLRQKVSELAAGSPPLPDYAPEMWQPIGAEV